MQYGPHIALAMVTEEFRGLTIEEILVDWEATMLGGQRRGKGRAEIAGEGIAQIQYRWCNTT